jgi:hypothetical protein
MTRSILGVKAPQTESLAVLSVKAVSANAGTHLNAEQLRARLRQKRSPAYVATLTKLDAGDHVHSAASTQALMDAIQQEFPDIHIDYLPRGVVAKCHLGEPYEVHTLDCAGNIVQHYKVGQPLPSTLERARSLARGGQYAFIEVYVERLIAISESGQTAIIEL